MMQILLLSCATLALLGAAVRSQEARQLGRLQEVFAWKQLTYNINGNQIVQDRFADVEEEAGVGNSTRETRQAPARNWHPGQGPRTGDDSQRFFIQYNNLPMGVERAGNRLFITVPRRRLVVQKRGIPSTLNYLDLTEDGYTRSPGLRPYPSLRDAAALVSVYRTRADHCHRLWMVDNGMLELPDNRQQLQQPSIVVYDLTTDRMILRYPLKDTDIITRDTPAGLASITLDFLEQSCSSNNVYAYIPDLATYGLIVYSLKDNDSWRLQHNFFHFNPLAGNLRVSGQYFTWNDGIFSITLTAPRQSSCRTAYFHPMVSTAEFAVSTCLLRNKTAIADPNYWQEFSYVGDRGSNSQSTMHGFHEGSSVVLFADIGRDSLSCWHTGAALSPASIGLLASDSMRLGYPSDLHVTGDEVWLMANNLPTWAYGRLNTNEYNFYIYRANIYDLIAGTVCGVDVRRT